MSGPRFGVGALVVRGSRPGPAHVVITHSYARRKAEWAEDTEFVSFACDYRAHKAKPYRFAREVVGDHLCQRNGCSPVRRQRQV